MNSVYLAYLGDEWLSRDSLELIGVFSASKKALVGIKNKLKKNGEAIGYINPDGLQGEIGIKRRRREFETTGRFLIEIYSLNQI